MTSLTGRGPDNSNIEVMCSKILLRRFSRDLFLFLEGKLLIKEHKHQTTKYWKNTKIDLV
jgi:hypothetical protein